MTASLDELGDLYSPYAGLPQGHSSKESICNAGGAVDSGSIPGLGRSPGGGNGNPLQYSCLENPMDSGAWHATVQGVTKSWTGLKHLSMHTQSFTIKSLRFCNKEQEQSHELHFFLNVHS